MSELLVFTMDKLMGKLQHEGTKLKREAKKLAEMETAIERNMREAMSDKHYGCANSVLHEIAVACNNYNERQKVLNRAWEKLQSTPDRWCRILKTLVLLDYLLKNGPEQILGELSCEQNHIRRVLHLTYMEEGKDRGAAVRDKAKAVLDLVQDKNLLRDEREKARQHRAKMAGGGSSVQDGFGDGPRHGSAGQAPSMSKKTFDERFNELKRKQEQERAAKDRGVAVRDEVDNHRKDSDDDRKPRVRRDGRDDRTRDDSPKDRRRRDDSPPPRRGRRRDDSSDSDRDARPRRGRNSSNDKPSDKPSESGYDLFDPSSAGNAETKQAGPAGVADLLDLVGGGGPGAPASPAASGPQGDWAAFESAPPAPAAAPDLFDVGDPPPSAAEPDLLGGGGDSDFLGDSAFQSAPGFPPAGGAPPATGVFPMASPGMPPAPSPSQVSLVGGFPQQPAVPFAAGPSMQPGVEFGGFAAAQPMQHTPPPMFGGYPAVHGGVGVTAAPASMAQPSYASSAPATAAMRPKEPEKVELSQEDLAKKLCDFNLQSDSKSGTSGAERPAAALADLGVDMFRTP